MQKIKRQGFTMVELSLAMVFVSILSIIIVLIIANSVSSYRRGLTLNQINTVGMDLVDGFKRAIQASPARSLEQECTEIFQGSSSAGQKCIENLGKNLAVVKKTSKIDGSNVPVAGVFCTGKYSYVWNSGYFFTEPKKVAGLNPVSLRYKVAGAATAETKENIRLIKLIDENRSVCRKAAGIASNSYSGTFADSVIDISDGAIDEEPEELLLSNDEYSNLAIYDLDIATPAKVEGVNSVLYTVTFVLGTLQGGAKVTAAGNNCIPPEEGAAEFDYCAINKFNFAAQAIGG